MEVDLLVQARWVVPVEPAGTVLDDHAVAVRDGRIVAVCPAAEAAQFTAQTHLTLDHHLLCPGFINAH
ncbi:MAG TPA: TRZ/ATZ family hydrolase, partial [Gammaproteobacteria bacterium]|nr:TRZ/ATZ family hydrolase [Gammaproteobacteria bacterium]